MVANDTASAAARERTARFAVGDPEAIREVYRTYGQLVYAVTYRILGDVGPAEDAVEQTFVRAWREARTASPARALGPWLASIAHRVAVGASASSATSTPSLEQIYDVWEVRQALQDLPVEDRELIRLQHHGELTDAEIAGQLSIAPGTVPCRNFHAHRRLAHLLRLAT